MSQFFLQGSGGGGGGSFTSINVVTFTTPGSSSYTPSSGLKYAIVEISAGGGAGGGNPGLNVLPGASGGGGEYAKGVFSAATIGSSQTVTIGAGGTGVSGNDGNDGDDTSFGALLTAIGGQGGVASTAPPTTGGNGGSGGTGGFLHVPGGNGSNTATEDSLSNIGGTSFYGVPGQPVALGVTQGVDGNPGLGYGSGGGGATASTSVEVPLTGGDGASGICIVTEFIGT